MPSKILTAASDELADKRPLAHNTAVEAQDVEDGLDRANLKILRTRFLDLNQQRLERLRHALLPSQRIFLDLLPLLFHINHPALPGYGSAATPRGIRNFKLTRQQVKSARTLNKSFALQREVNPPQEIGGIYLMGSCGSLAHSGRSDIDIWVCPANNLSPQHRSNLEARCEQIKAWAETLCLEVHCFIMDAEEFRAGQRAAMDSENCGNTQHFLLLDEFYRTHILIAGCEPLWWYVPAAFEDTYQNYAQTLLGKRYLNELSCINFGTPGQIPATEYISAGIWQLYKGLDSPYKALLKLMLIEVYASEFPDTANLSSLFKSAVYGGETSTNELDPYIQVYRRVERYLLDRGENDRLELVRRSLYFKVGIKLSAVPSEEGPEQILKSAQADPRHWKRKTLHKLVSDWGWRRPKLLTLDRRESWSFNAIMVEQKRLTKELLHSYRLLSSMVKNRREDSATGQPAANTAELNILGRQLYAAFEQKPHKISRLSASVVHSTEQPSLYFKQEINSQGNANWSAMLEQSATQRELNEAEQQIAKTAKNPVELLVWCIVNGLATDNTRLRIEPGDHELTEYELKQLYTALAVKLPGHSLETTYEQVKTIFAKPAATTHCLFIVNCGLDPLKQKREQDFWLISEKSDPLDYSGIAENLIGSISLVTVNSWGEVFSYHFEGREAINHSLAHYYSRIHSDSNSNASASAQQVQQHVICACPTRPAAIANRLQCLLEDIEGCFFTAVAESQDSKTTPAINDPRPSAKQFIFQSAYGYHVFSWQNGEPNIALYGNEHALLETLSRPEQIGTFAIDRLALQDHPLSAIYRKLETSRELLTQNSPALSASQSSATPGNCVSVFYEIVDDVAHTYLVDQQCALVFAKIPYESLRSLVTPIRQFVESNALRRLASTPGADHHEAQTFAISTEMPAIAFYTLKKSGRGYSTAHLPTESRISTNYFSVKALGEQNSLGEISWTIFCEEHSFQQSDLGASLFAEVARSIAAHRKPNQPHYRCYITDIEINRNAHRPSSLAEDFYYKNQLEEQINRAFSAIGN